MNSRPDYYHRIGNKWHYSPLYNHFPVQYTAVMLTIKPVGREGIETIDRGNGKKRVSSNPEAIDPDINPERHKNSGPASGGVIGDVRQNR